MTAPAADPALKLVNLVKPCIDEGFKQMKDYIVVHNQELLLEIQSLKTQISVLEKLVANNKKSRDKKPAAEGAVAPPAPAGDTVVQPPTNAPEAFPVNKLVYFRGKFKASAEFRAKYTDEKMQELMNKDETIISKPKEEQKLIAQASWCWTYIKNNRADLMTLIDNEFAQEKALHEVAAKPPQQTAEAGTPKADKMS